MLARLVADIEELQNFYLRVVSPIVVALVIGLFTFGLFSIFSMGMAWVSLAFLAAAGSGVPLLAMSLSRGLGRQQLKARAELNTHVVDSLQGIQDVLAFGRSQARLESVAACDRALGHAQRRMARITGLQIALGDLLMNTAMWVLIILAIPLVATGSLDGVYLGVIGLLMLASFEAVQPLASAFQGLGHSRAAAERVFAVTDVQPPVTESTTPQPLPANVGGSNVYGLSFEHVHFSYRPGEREVLSDISFALRPGGHIAIVGPSGAGKSTLLRLAARFWDPTSGIIRLLLAGEGSELLAGKGSENGQDIRRYSLHDLRDQIGIVAQDTYIFNDTLLANLLLARPAASDAEVESAVEQAQLTDFVRQLPQGLKTRVGEQGLHLSGGERQRLAIARALLKDAPILILDEATANLDPVIERTLLDTLSTLMRGRTTLQLTHRLLGMERMDEILVLQRGCIVERGTHDDLLAREGLYRQLFDVQNGVLNFS